MRNFTIATVEQTLAYLGYRDFADDPEDWQQLNHEEKIYFLFAVGNELAEIKLLPAPQP
jgi:hypothetical protein